MSTTVDTSGEHDGGVRPLSHQHGVLKAHRTGEQHLGPDLILQARQELVQGRPIIQGSGAELKLEAPELRNVRLDGCGLAQGLELASELHFPVNITELIVKSIK